MAHARQKKAGATSGDVAIGASIDQVRLTTKSATKKGKQPKIEHGLLKPLPLGSGRADHFDSVFGAEPDLEAFQVANEYLRTHPDTEVKARIEHALTALHLDPEVHLKSRELTRFVFLMRDLIADFLPGMTLEQMLQPLQTLLSRYGGGRPSVASEYAAWLAEYELRQRCNRTGKKASEIYADIAEGVNEGRVRAGQKPIKWTQIRDGISEARKAANNRV